MHDSNASWPDAGYTEDYVKGENNMNEEWWGICAKGQPDSRGLYELYPRAAYYALRKVFALDPYDSHALHPPVQQKCLPVEVEVQQSATTHPVQFIWFSGLGSLSDARRKAGSSSPNTRGVPSR